MWHDLLRRLAACRDELDTGTTNWLATYRSQGGRIYCGQGCSGCCTLFVQTTIVEALACAHACNADLRTALAAFVARQQTLLADVVDLKTGLQLQRRQLGPCPFLDSSGSCAIYAIRPLACRALLSTRPADWCAVDFATLDPFDKQAYLSSLDRTVVSYPVHYVAAPQQRAQQLEAELLHHLGAAWGVTVTGSLPYLVHLELSLGLSELLPRGYAATSAALQAQTRQYPLLVQCRPWRQDD